MESGALPAILSLMGPSQTPGCQEAAARAFGNLVCDNMSPQLRAAAEQVWQGAWGFLEGFWEPHFGNGVGTRVWGLGLGAGALASCCRRAVRGAAGGG